MITRPLELESRMSPPPRDLDFVAWVNVGVIVLFFGLFDSGFVLAPGLPVGVGSMMLPAVGTASQEVGTVSVVAKFRSNNLILFEDGKYSLSELRKPMEAYVKRHPGAIVLFVADHQVSVQSFADFCEVARSAGFEHVIMGGDRPGTKAPAN